jgi:hypothetical protein
MTEKILLLSFLFFVSELNAQFQSARDPHSRLDLVASGDVIGLRLSFLITLSNQ